MPTIHSDAIKVKRKSSTSLYRRMSFNQKTFNQAPLRYIEGEKMTRVLKFNLEIMASIKRLQALQTDCSYWLYEAPCKLMPFLLLVDVRHAISIITKSTFSRSYVEPSYNRVLH